MIPNPYPEIITETGTSNRYELLKQRRNATEERGKKYAEYTVPYVAPRITDGENQSEVTLDLNAIGPRAVQYLANKYMMTLFPPNRSSFKLEIDDKTKAALAANGINMKEVALTIAKIEDAAKKYLAGIGSRAVLLELLIHLLVVGNCLLYYPKNGPMQLYPLDSYVLRRHLDGKIAEIITKDMKALEDLPLEYQNVIIAKLQIPPEEVQYRQVNLYTHIELEGKKYRVSQSVEHVAVGQPYYVPENGLRWLPQTLRRFRRETYGRGLVEDYINVFHALSILQECLITAAAIATDVKYTVKPGSMLDIPTLVQSPSGSFHIGDEDDIGNTGLDGRLSDLQFVEAMINRLERLIGSVFLINSAVTRDAERVTREEIRMQAQELETAHGGIYSVLNEELLLPLARLTLESIDVKLDNTNFEPVILTGLDAMGRATVNDNVMTLFQQLGLLKNVPDALQAEIDPLKLLVLLAEGLDIDATKITPTRAEKIAKQEATVNAQRNQMNAEAAAKGMSQQIGNASPEVAAAIAEQMT